MVGWTDCVFDTLGNLTQDHITDGMSKLDVDPIKVIAVEEDGNKIPAATLGATVFGFEGALEAGPTQNKGGSVNVGYGIELFYSGAELGDGLVELIFEFF